MEDISILNLKKYPIFLYLFDVWLPGLCAKLLSAAAGYLEWY